MVFPFNITFGNLKHCLLGWHQETKRSGKDKIMTVENIALTFSIFFVDLVRMLDSSFGVYMIQTTKFSQEDKVWLIVVVF